VSTTRPHRLPAAAVTGLLAVVLAGCGGNVTQGGVNTHEGQNEGTGQTATPAQSMLPFSGSEFGPACADLPSDPADPGSMIAMTREPVGTAMSSVSMVRTFGRALRTTGLAKTLDEADAATVFAPTEEAFGKLPKARLDALTADRTALRDLVARHVVPDRRVTTRELTSGPLTTMQKGTVDVTGGGEDFTVGGSAHIVCGSVQTSNATVYFIDTLLLPAE
jgi:uncharacterized surface protein with fasciclin (FAS1) repeats